MSQSPERRPVSEGPDKRPGCAGRRLPELLRVQAAGLTPPAPTLPVSLVARASGEDRDARKKRGSAGFSTHAKTTARRGGRIVGVGRVSG
jgi:hypothetical protein